jgi:hypothetical protein
VVVSEIGSDQQGEKNEGKGERDRSTLSRREGSGKDLFFWFSSPDDWVINNKTKLIIMLEFKRVSDTTETYYSDMKSIA